MFILMVACQDTETPKEETKTASTDSAEKKPVPISEPLVKHIYTADPSAHVFDGKIYIYPSHDIEAGIK